MKLYIEVLVIFGLMIMFVLWKMWYWFSTKRLLKKYNPEKDLGKSGENLIQNGKKIESKSGRESIRRTSEVRRREPESQASTSSSVGLEQPQGRGLLQTATVNAAGKNSKGTGMSVPVREDKKRPTRSRRSRRRFG